MVPNKRRMACHMQATNPYQRLYSAEFEGCTFAHCVEWAVGQTLHAQVC